MVLIKKEKEIPGGPWMRVNGSTSASLTAAFWYSFSGWNPQLGCSVTIEKSGGSGDSNLPDKDFKHREPL